MSHTLGRRRYSLPILWYSLTIATSALAACGGPAPSEPTALEGSLEPLRSDFNADAGKVRAVFLASPT